MAVPLFGIDTPQPNDRHDEATTSTWTRSSCEHVRPSLEHRKQHLFLELKAICVPILTLSRLSPSTPRSSQQLLSLLSTLSDKLSKIKTEEFSPALANYILFPLTSILNPEVPTKVPRSDSVIDSTIATLTRLITRWKQVEFDPRIRNELWIMIILRLGGPLDPNLPRRRDQAGKGKGKEIDMSDEVALVHVEALLQLMTPECDTPTTLQDEDDDPLGQNIDWTLDDPFVDNPSSRQKTRLKRPNSPPIPILFHTLTTLSDLSSIPTSLVKLQLLSLESLDLLLNLYLTQHPPSSTSSSELNKGPSPLLATALPATASNLSRIALSSTFSASLSDGNSRQRQSEKVIIEALNVLKNLLVLVINDRVTLGLRSNVTIVEEVASTTLEELLENFIEPSIIEKKPSQEIIPAIASNGTDSIGDTSFSASKGPVKPSSSWLAYTLRSIESLITSLTPLLNHDSPNVRIALVLLLSTLEKECKSTLKEHRKIVLEMILILSKDEWEIVSNRAIESLDSLIKDEEFLKLIRQLTIERLRSLSRSIRSNSNSQRIINSCKLIRSGLQKFGTDDRLLLGFDKWKLTLFDSMIIKDVMIHKRGGEWIELSWIESTTSSTQDHERTAFPEIEFKFIQEREVIKELTALFESIGSLTVKSGKELEVIDGFWIVVVGPRAGEKIAESALWVLNCVLRGFEGVEVDKRRRKVLRGLIKGILGLLERLEEGKEEARSQEKKNEEEQGDRSLIEAGEKDVVMQHQQGLTITPELNKYKPVVSTDVKKDSAISHRIWLQCLLLRVLSTCATLLGSSFQPHLLSALYHILAHLSPASHPFLRSHAQHALTIVSDATAYAAPSNLILANVDYVINSVSQRLSITRLDPSAPLVLVEMIRLVGPPIVPMVQDLVQDVFEALDDFHGYDQVTVGLWAVLDALIRVMSDEAVAQNEEMMIDREKVKIEVKSDWDEFVEWYKSRDDPPEEELLDDSMPEKNPQKPFAVADTVPPTDDTMEEPSFPSDEPQTPATRPQEVAAQIISKSVYFLSHSSPFLRARVLSLLANSIPLLAQRSPYASGESQPRLNQSSREADLLPVIHRAWPYILNRVNDPDPSVILAASELIAALAKHVGSFMSRKILEDVWPRMKVLFEKRSEIDRLSTANAMTGAKKYSVSFAIYSALLEVLIKVTRDVPLKEEVVWDISMALRRFLDRREEKELREKAVEIYRALGTVNADAVWVVMMGLRGQGEAWMGINGFEGGEEMFSIIEQL